MKIRLALLDNDENYLNRIVSTLNIKYPDKFEIYSFSIAESALSNLIPAKIDVLLANNSFNINIASLPEECGFAYLTDEIGVDHIDNERAISKFQKVDLIYRQILSIYSEKASNLTSLMDNNGKGNIIVFSSPCGGAGTSTMAAACAVNIAKREKKVLYLNFEKFGSSDCCFSAVGQFDLSDIIFSLKSKKGNLPVKLESCVKQDESGVYFFSQPKVALDMLELSYNDMMQLLTEIKISGEYEYIVLDVDFVMTKESMELYKKSRAWIWVSDGTAAANTKVERAFSALSIMDKNNNTRIAERVLLAYNKYDKQSNVIEGLGDVVNLGIVPYSGAFAQKQMVDKISQVDMFDKVINWRL